MGDSRIRHIPFRELERMGLWVIDSGDGGRDDDIGEPAVDAADQALRVVSASGHTVYDSRDDSFPAFHRVMQAVLAGKATRWNSTVRPQSGSATERIRHFTHGQLTTTCVVYEHAAEERQLTGSDCFAYERGQTLQRWDRTRWIKPEKKVPMSSSGGSSNLRTMDALTWSIWRDGATLTVEDLLQEKNYPVDSLTEAETVLATIRAEHQRMGFSLVPTAWGYRATLHGVPIRIWIDPTAGELNRFTVVDVMAGLARMPPPLLRIMLRFRIQKYREPFLALQIVDSYRVSTDLALLRRRMQSGVRFSPVESMFGISVFGKPLPPLLHTTLQPSPRTSYDRLEWYAHLLEEDDKEHEAKYAPRTGRIEVTKALTSSRTIRHEYGHMVEHLLGAEFSADVAALYAPYMEHVLATELASAPVRAAWESLQKSQWKALTPADRALLDPFFAQASEHGLLPSGYAGTGPKEWFAELFAATWSGTQRDDAPIPSNAPYRFMLQSIRMAMTKGRTPTQIRQLFRQSVMER